MSDDIMKRVNEESLKTLREMMKEIDEAEYSKELQIRRKAIFRAIEVIGAYDSGQIIDAENIKELLKKVNHEITTETGLYATDRLDTIDPKFDSVYWRLDHTELANEIDKVLKEVEQ